LRGTGPTLTPPVLAARSPPARPSPRFRNVRFDICERSTTSKTKPDSRLLPIILRLRAWAKGQSAPRELRAIGGLVSGLMPAASPRPPCVSAGTGALSGEQLVRRRRLRLGSQAWARTSPDADRADSPTGAIGGRASPCRLPPPSPAARPTQATRSQAKLSSTPKASARVASRASILAAYANANARHHAAVLMLQNVAVKDIVP